MMHSGSPSRSPEHPTVADSAKAGSTVELAATSAARARRNRRAGVLDLITELGDIWLFRIEGVVGV
jgi:hypothetical protein